MRDKIKELLPEQEPNTIGRTLVKLTEIFPSKVSKPSTGFFKLIISVSRKPPDCTARAVIYSLIATCRLNKVNPEKWLAEVLSRLPDTKQSQLDDLLPHKLLKNTPFTEAKLIPRQFTSGRGIVEGYSAVEGYV